MDIFNDFFIGFGVVGCLFVLSWFIFHRERTIDSITFKYADDLALSIFTYLYITASVTTLVVGINGLS